MLETNAVAERIWMTVIADVEQLDTILGGGILARHFQGQSRQGGQWADAKKIFQGNRGLFLEIPCVIVREGSDALVRWLVQ